MKTILILDDIYENLYLLRVILENTGYKVIEANDGKDGLDKLHKNSIDLIISDILMPVMDGYMFCQACKKDELFKNIPFVFYTSTYTEKSDEDFALKLGANNFLRKPTDPDVILQLVKKLLVKSKAEPKPAKKVQFTEKEVLRLYSKRLISKLEQKNLDLEKEVLERKKAEQLLIHENEILDLIAVNTPLNKIFDRLLLNFESVHSNYLGSISLLDEDGIHLNLISAPSMSESFSLALKGLVIGKDVGSCGTSAFTKKPVIVSDVTTDNLWEDYRDLALNNDIMSCWSLPILSKNNNVFGTFAIYSQSKSTPSLEDIRELKLAVSLTTIAIVKSRNVAEIKKQDESYRSLIDQASDAIVTYSLDGTIHGFNKAAYSSLGYTKTEFLKFKIQDFSSGELVQNNENLKNLLNGDAVIFDRQFTCKDNSVIDVEISAKLQKDGKILGIARDVTEWRNNLKEIKKEKEFSSGLLSSMREGLVAVNLDSKIISANPSFCEMTGFTEKELLGVKRPYPFSPPEIKEVNDIRYKSLLQNKNKSDYESTYMRKNGERFPAHVLISSIYDENGVKTANFATVQDITQRKKAELELKIANEFTDKLVMSMQEGLFILDLDGKIKIVNNSTCKILGYSRKELIGLELPYPFSKEEDYEKFSKINESVAKGEAPVFKLKFIRKNGEEFTASFLTGNIKNDKGDVIALFGTIKDISEEEKAKWILENNAKKSLERKNVIIELASLVGTNYKEALNKITALSGKTLNIERASVLKFNKEKTEIFCEKLFTQKSNDYVSGLVLYKKGNESYFETLNQNKIINASDALNNKLTKGFIKDYLVPFNIKSKLSIPIQGVNEVYGILCFEQVDTKHDWNSEEEEFATSIANLVSLMVESSERKAAEKELKSEKEFSEKLITSLHEGLSVVDLNGKHIKVNAALCKMTGFTEEELIGVKAPFPYWPPEEYDVIYEAFNNQSESVGEIKEYTLMRKNGERFPASFSASVIKNNEGEIVAYFSTISDITNRVKVETILKENIKVSDQRKNTIIELASLIGNDFNSSLKKIAKASAKALNVDMVTIWEFKTDKTELLSKLYYNTLEHSFIKDGLIIKKEDFPNYFNAFKDKNSINITDAINNPITKAFAKQYFLPNNTSSIMDVLIYGRNDHYGIISFECTSDKRVFTNEEESFVTSIASIVSLMVESFDRELAEKESVIANKQLTIANKELVVLRNQLEQENVYLRNELDLVFNYEEMVYGSAEFGNVLTEIEKVAPTDATVLLLGESGTGKELLARAIHNISKRNNKPLIKVNCSAIPRELFESELFGHKKGSFTGAYGDKIGKFELADNGTLFLDEIGELPLDMQPKILRFLQEGEIEVVGGAGVKKLNVRVIAATNRNLKEEIKKKQFREDLYFRLNVFPVDVPPLSKRIDDIPLLVEHFVDKFNKAYGKNIKFITDEAMDKLKSYDWPGNIRELENLIERASILSSDETLLIPGFESSNQKAKSINNKDLSLDAAQRNHILQILEQCNWKISGTKGAAELLKLKPSTLRDKMKKLDLKKPL